ncbi:MAG: alginate export family protein [Bdellovibrionales bacterium]
MKRFTIALAGLALATTAQAADTTDFKWDAEMRLRYTNDAGYNFQKEVSTTATGNGNNINAANTAGRNYNGVAQRVKVGVGMKRGDSLSGYVSIINHNFWGGTGGRTAAGDYTYGNNENVGTGTAGNVFIVNEAWGWWKASDMAALKFGRSQMEIAGGAVAGPNDWQAIPNTFDGLQTMWDFEPVSLNLFGLKLRDLNPNGAAQTTQTDDAESVMYGLVAGIKNLPEFLKKAEIHLLQTNDETTTSFVGATTSTDRNEIMRYGFIVGGDAANVDYKFITDMYTGKKKVSPSTASTGDQNLTGSMFDLTVGYTLPEVMMLRIGGNYHMDSGGEVTATDNKTYKPFHYSSHEFGGNMDVVQWGNVTYWGLNAGIKPTDDLGVRLDYLSYSRTSDRDSVSINGATQSAETGTTTAGSSNKIGSEIDLTVTKTYGDNLSVWALYGVFTPDEFIKGNPASARDDAHTRIQLQGKLTF